MCLRIQNQQYLISLYSRPSKNSFLAKSECDNPTSADDGVNSWISHDRTFTIGDEGDEMFYKKNELFV